MPLSRMQRLGKIDSTEMYFCGLAAYARFPAALSSISSTLILFDAGSPISGESEACLNASMSSGAVHIILTGSAAHEYEDALDRMIVQSGIERLYHSTICTYAILDFEEALNLAVCIDEQAILLLAHDLNDVRANLIDFGMED